MSVLQKIWVMHEEPLLQKVDNPFSLRFLIKSVVECLFLKNQILSIWKCTMLRMTSTLHAPAGSDCSHQPATTLSFNPPSQPLLLPISFSPHWAALAIGAHLIINFMLLKKWSRTFSGVWEGGRWYWEQNPNTAMRAESQHNHAKHSILKS